MQQKQIKIVGIVAVIIVLLNLVLFSFTVISWQVFLVVLVFGYVFVKWGLPKLKN
tara:strand:+ start:148 stop:312 length:165 start_codon:yes stop_codon:yes gene_type:complete